MKIKISFLFFAVLTLLFIVDTKGLAVISLLCAALHEMGHILAMICFKNTPDEIVLGIFGIRMQQNKYTLSDLQQGVVVLCGPLVNIALSMISLLISLALEGDTMLMVSAVNLVMALFNLLPIMPLDGGRILTLLLNRFFSERTAQKIMRITCVLLLFALVVSGAFLAIQTGFNVSLLATGAYLCALCIKSIRIGY